MNNTFLLKFSRVFKWLPKAIQDEAKETDTSYTHVLS